MKTAIALSCLFVLLFGFSVQAADISGGIVCTDGKNAVYYDFQTRQTIILVRGAGQAAIDPWGTTIVYTTGRNQLAQMILPDGNPVAFRDLEQPQSKSGDPKEDKFICGEKPYPSQEDVKHLAVSPPSSQPFFIAFEYPRKGRKWTLCPLGSKLYDELYNKDVPEGVRKYDLPDNLPRYAMEWITRTTTDVFMLQKTSDGSLLSWIYGSDGYDASVERYLYRVPPNKGTVVYKEGKTLPSDYHEVKSPIRVFLERGLAGNEIVSKEEAIRREKEACASGAESACFPTWSPILTPVPTVHSEWPALAVIYYSHNKQSWNTIMVDYPGVNTYLNFRRISVSLNSCQGLAFKPDGTITYESEGKIYSEDGKVLAEGIKVTRFYWTSEDTLLFRTPEGTLCAWKAGKTEKLLNSIPEEFSYTPYSLVTTSSGKTKVAKHGDLGVLYLRTIRIPCWDVTSFSETPEGVAVKTNAGKMLFGEAKKSVYIGTEQPAVNPYTLEYAFPPETKIEDIKNPASYRYQRGGEGVYKQQVVSLNQILLLKLGNNYAALKPVEINVGKKIPLPGKPGAFTRGEDTYMVYEWKYWPAKR